MTITNNPDLMNEVSKKLDKDFFKFDKIKEKFKTKNYIYLRNSQMNEIGEIYQKYRNSNLVFSETTKNECLMELSLNFLLKFEYYIQKALDEKMFEQESFEDDFYKYGYQLLFICNNGFKIFFGNDFALNYTSSLNNISEITIDKKKKEDFNSLIDNMFIKIKTLLPA